jgi:hypothetical protein
MIEKILVKIVLLCRLLIELGISKVNEHKVLIPSSIGNLEGQMIESESNLPFGIVICHPHPMFGGTMANDIVRAVYKYFGNQGYPALRFNFRGVGNSPGWFTDGEGEREDAISAVQFLCSQQPAIERILIIGYSFGAMIGASIIDEMDIIWGYIAISYPFTMLPRYISQAQSSKPKLFLMGEQDDYTSIEAFRTNFDLMPEPKTQQLFPNVDHFWQGSETQLCSSIENWICQNVN